MHVLSVECRRIGNNLARMEPLFCFGKQSTLFLQAMSRALSVPKNRALPLPFPCLSKKKNALLCSSRTQDPPFLKKNFRLLLSYPIRELTVNHELSKKSGIEELTVEPDVGGELLGLAAPCVEVVEDVLHGAVPLLPAPWLLRRCRGIPHDHVRRQILVPARRRPLRRLLVLRVRARRRRRAHLPRAPPGRLRGSSRLCALCKGMSSSRPRLAVGRVCALRRSTAGGVSVVLAVLALHGWKRVVHEAWRGGEYRCWWNGAELGGCRNWEKDERIRLMLTTRGRITFFFIAWTAACRRGSEAKFRHGRTRRAWSVPDTVLREQEPSRRSAHVDDGDLAAETTCSRAAAP
jgi:hypothetical protein